MPQIPRDPPPPKPDTLPPKAPPPKKEAPKKEPAPPPKSAPAKSARKPDAMHARINFAEGMALERWDARTGTTAADRPERLGTLAREAAGDPRKIFDYAKAFDETNQAPRAS